MDKVSETKREDDDLLMSKQQKEKPEGELEAPNLWIHTNSGKQFSFNYTQLDQICIEDIAAHLSKICRYVGAIDEFYSVADHCCNLVDYLIDKDPVGINPYFLLGVLLHDAPEAYLSDIAAPAKSLPEFRGYKKVEKRIYGFIAEKFGAPNDANFHTVLDYYDKNIIRDEAQVLFEIQPSWALDYELLEAVIEISPDHRAAKQRYLDTYDDIMDRIAVYGMGPNEEESYEQIQG